MKVLLFILGLAVCRGLPILGGYQMVDTIEAQQSTEIQNLIQVGLEQILQAGIQKGDFSSENFVLSKINSVYRQVLNGENYKFNCDFTNDQNQQVTASFEVKTGGSGSVRTTVSSYSYQVKTVTITQIVSQTFVEVSSSEVQYSTEIQTNLDFGLQQAIDRAIQEGKIPNFSYDLLEIKDVSRQVVESALFYKFNCSITNNAGIVVQATFTVYYQPLLGEQSLADYSCEVEGDTEEQSEEQEQEATTEEESTGTQTTGTGTGTTTEIFQPVESQYVQILVTQVETNQVIKNCLDFGWQQVIQAGVNEGKIPNSSFNVSEILEAYNQILGNGVFYKFTIKLINTQNVVIQATFTVYYEITTRTNTLASYSYQVLVTGSGGTGSVSSSTTTGTQTVPEVDTEIETGGTGTTITETIIPEQEDESTQTDTSIVDVELELGQETQGGFTSISVEEARENTEVYSNVEFGFNTVIQKGQDSGKIPNTSFTIQILEASVKRGTNGDLYKFKCQGTNQQGAVIEMYFTVYYYFSSQRRTLSSYSYFISSSQTTTQPNTQPSQPVQGSYVELSQQQISSSEVQNALNYGTSQIYILGVASGDIQESQFSIVSVTSVQKKETVNGVSYKCEVTSSNQKNVNLVMSFTIFYQSSTKQTILSQYSYRVQEISNPAPPDNTNTDDSYTTVDKSEFSSQAIQSVIDFGIQYILQQGYKSKKIPVSDYQITNIVSVSRKSERRGIYYKCRVELEDVNEVLITASFTIRDTYDTHEKWVQSWKYHVSNIRTKTKEETKVVDTAYIEVDRSEIDYSNEVKSCLDYGVNQVVSDSNYVVTTINHVYRQVVKSALYYKFEVELTNQRSNKIMRLTFTVYYKPDVGDRNVNAYSYSIRTRSSSSSSSSSSWSWSTSSSSSSSSSRRYRQIRTSTVESSSKYQDIVQYGVRECVNKLVNINVVATADFQVSQILSAFSQEVSNDENCKFKVRLSNSFGISLDVNFNVKYDKRSGSKTLTSYSVAGSSDAQTDVMVVDSTNAQDDEVAVGNCQKVNTAEVTSNSNVQDAIDYGVQQVVQTVTKEQNTRSDFSVQQIKNVYREVVDNQSYRVEATLKNSQGINVDCSFSVSAQTSSKQVTSLSYITYS